MKAMVLNGYSLIERRPLSLSDVDIPTPEKDEILIKVKVCGACHTDLDIAQGRVHANLPIIPGHQVVGLVVDKGDTASRFTTGARVGVTWLYSSCGRCSFCRTGRENLCEHAKWTGKDSPGGYAEYMVIREDFAYPLPAKFSDYQAAPLLCAGVIGYRTLKLAEIQDGETIGLFGFGASAHIVIQIIKYKFPHSPVFVFTKTQEHAELAKNLGAVWTGRSGEIAPVMLDKIMDFTPAGECVRDALLVLNRGGRLVINAIRKETAVPELEYAKYLWLEKEIKSVANVTRMDTEEFLPLAAQIPVTVTVEKFPLEEANDVLLAIKQSSVRGAAVLTICE